MTKEDNTLSTKEWRPLKAALLKWQERNLERNKEIKEELNKTVSSVTTFILIILLITILSILVTIQLITRNIVSSLNIFQNGLLSFFAFSNKESSNVELINLDGNDEFGIMAKVINENIAKTQEEQMVAKELGLLTGKPVLFCVNVSEHHLEKGVEELTAYYAQLLSAQKEDVCVISAKIESEVSSLSQEDQAAFLADLGLEESGLERLIKKAYEMLHLQSFLTAGEKEVRAWTIHKGATASEAAGVIHTDFTKLFIKARVASFDDFVSLGGWKGVREAGKMRTEGREYQMQVNDVVEFAIGT